MQSLAWEIHSGTPTNSSPVACPLQELLIELEMVLQSSASLCRNQISSCIIISWTIEQPPKEEQEASTCQSPWVAATIILEWCDSRMSLPQKVKSMPAWTALVASAFAIWAHVMWMGHPLPQILRIGVVLSAFWARVTSSCFYIIIYYHHYYYISLYLYVIMLFLFLTFRFVCSDLFAPVLVASFLNQLRLSNLLQAIGAAASSSLPPEEGIPGKDEWLGRIHWSYYVLMAEIQETTRDDDYPHDFRVSIHPRWLFGISSINSMMMDAVRRFLITSQLHSGPKVFIAHGSSGWYQDLEGASSCSPGYCRWQADCSKNPWKHRAACRRIMNFNADRQFQNMSWKKQSRK